MNASARSDRQAEGANGESEQECDLQVHGLRPGLSEVPSLMRLSSEILMLAAGRDAADETCTAGKAWQKKVKKEKQKTLPTGCGFRFP